MSEKKIKSRTIEQMMEDQEFFYGIERELLDDFKDEMATVRLFDSEAQKILMADEVINKISMTRNGWDAFMKYIQESKKRKYGFPFIVDVTIRPRLVDAITWSISVKSVEEEGEEG